LPSLFEEQIRQEDFELRRRQSGGVELPSRKLRHAPGGERFVFDSKAYVSHFRQAREEVRIPVIPSLNGVTAGGWVRFAQQLEDAGAPAIELNLYYVPTDPGVPGERVENLLLKTFEAVRGETRIPLAVKLSPYFSNTANMARRLVDAGADGLVLFNRFYQPDVELESRTVDPRPLLSFGTELRLPMRWITILAGKLSASLAASGGVLTGADVVRVIMSGADVAMVCSALLRGGIDQSVTILCELEEWLEQHGHKDLDEIRGTLIRGAPADSPAFERGQYIRAIHGETRS
jgi:dihydroorotate dehydrogenase (fumarate)